MLDAAKQGRLEEVQRLVRGGAVDVTQGDGRGITALVWAARTGHFEVVRWLVREGVCRNARSCAKRRLFDPKKAANKPVSHHRSTHNARE